MHLLILVHFTANQGNYGKLVPIINDGKITSVRIDNPGIGYTG